MNVWPVCHVPQSFFAQELELPAEALMPEPAAGASRTSDHQMNLSLITVCTGLLGQDLELPAEALAPEPAAGASVPFAAPTPGVAPPARWLQKCGLAAEHAAAGDFASAMRLLERCGPPAGVLSGGHPVRSAVLAHDTTPCRSSCRPSWPVLVKCFCILDLVRACSD